MDPASGLTARELCVKRDAHGDASAVLEAAEDRCEQRRAELFAEDARKAPIECPRQCGGVPFPRESLSGHLLNDCELRPAGCDLCGSTLPLREMARHVSSQCPNRQQRCELCLEDVTATLWNAHADFRCRKRRVPCRMGCGETIVGEQQQQHEFFTCRNRGRPCPFAGCGAEVQAHKLQEHCRHECAFRKVKCRLGCGVTVAAGERDAHEQLVCTRVCEWSGCGERIGPAQTRRLHERFHCARRAVSCPHGCEVQGVAFDTMQQHAALHCAKRPSVCPSNCGWRGTAAELRQHVDAEGGQCEERHLRCRYELVGRRVEYKRGREDGRDVFERATLRRFRATTGSLWGEPCDGEFLLYGRAERPRWARLADLRELCFVDNAAWQCGWVAAADIKSHLLECAFRPKLAIEPLAEPADEDLARRARDLPSQAVRADDANGRTDFQQSAISSGPSHRSEEESGASVSWAREVFSALEDVDSCTVVKDDCDDWDGRSSASLRRSLVSRSDGASSRHHHHEQGGRDKRERRRPPPPRGSAHLQVIVIVRSCCDEDCAPPDAACRTSSQTA